MKKIGSYEAKTNLAGLLDKVANGGEEYTITKHGVPVAQLVPIPSAKRKDCKKIIAEVLELRKCRKLDKQQLKDLIDEGRKY